jgi:hypothetical protein
VLVLVLLREPRPVQCLVILRFKLRPVNVPFPLFVFVFLTMKDSTDAMLLMELLLQSLSYLLC